jgi:hypothetical protein
MLVCQQKFYLKIFTHSEKVNTMAKEHKWSEKQRKYHREYMRKWRQTRK